ncbi:TPA: hypothetical protein N0F65_004961 [Lagenidium giganteum]|uniref:Uncharacterized protein n=1 Tax=Lagenidium giganteum TaxID=4803 RepID=A0AAV2YMC6_9STRA|nr:TPA: hypothetical protein N0F65_004961 [Lagenidium giganteum]
MTKVARRARHSEMALGAKRNQDERDALGEAAHPK